MMILIQQGIRISACYETVLHRIKSSDDESWNDAVSDGKGHWRPRINIKYYGDDFEEYIMNIPDENQTLTQYFY